MKVLDLCNKLFSLIVIWLFNLLSVLMNMIHQNPSKDDFVDTSTTQQNLHYDYLVLNNSGSEVLSVPYLKLNSN